MITEFEDLQVKGKELDITKRFVKNSDFIRFN